MNHLIKITVILLITPISLFSQVALNSALGSFNKVDVQNNEYTFSTTNGKAKVIVYSPNTIRIRVERQNFEKTFSYAVVASPLKCKIRTNENGEYFTIQTDSLTLKIQKKPLRFSFYNLKDELINTDDPAFGTSWMGEEVTTYKALQDSERFIGLGEHTGNLDRNNDAFTNWNTDDPGYNGGSKSLYASIPFYMGIHHKLCYGIFFDNSAKTTFNFGAGNNRFSSFRADCGEMDYYFIYHSTISKIIESYTWLTGRMPLPPVWSLGYQQCRWSYFPESDVLSIAKKFRERHIPADMIYLDVHFMDAYKLFTWDKDRFPNPTRMIDELKKLSFHTSVIIDPGVKVEKNYKVYEDGINSDIFIKYPDGKRFEGKVWPGWCNFPDFTMPKARAWWGDWVKTYADQGVAGFWNDMNEIAAWGRDVPTLLELNWEGKKTSYREAKNVYGFLMARSSYEGAKKYMNGKRPFVLTRAGYSGLQRYTAIWTGDNQSTDDHMFLGVRLMNSMGLSGISFTGMDVGGFGGSPSPDLYARWMEIGAFLPMYRGHTAAFTTHTEPWVFGENFEDIARRYIGFRYQLMPYLYSNFYESTQSGMPVMRSLAIEYSFDKNIYDAKFQQQFQLGASLLVVPTKSNDRLGEVYLPDGSWYDLFNDKIYQGHQSVLCESPIEKLPVFVKAGSIIPMQPLTEATSDNAGDTLSVHIYKGSSNNSFVYYEDDGETFSYVDGNFFKRKISYQPEKNTIEFDRKEGNSTSKFKIITLVLHGFDSATLSKLKVNGENQSPKEQSQIFFSSHFQFANFGPKEDKKVLIISFKNSNEASTITW